MPDLGSCATPVVSKLGGEASRNPLFRSSKEPTRSTHTLVRDNSRSSRRNSPLMIGFPLPSGPGGGSHSYKWLPSIAHPVALVMSRSVVISFRHRMVPTIPPVPYPCGLRCHGVGRMYMRCAFAISLAHRMRHSCRWLVRRRGEIGWESQIGA
jgi:hypothetical protein